MLTFGREVVEILEKYFVFPDFFFSSPNIKRSLN